MLSADIVVQFPGSLESYNRYSYVRNNPLSRFDPAGFSEATSSTVILISTGTSILATPAEAATAVAAGAGAITVSSGMSAASAAPGFSGGNMYGGFGAANNEFSSWVMKRADANATQGDAAAKQASTPKAPAENGAQGSSPQSSGGGQMDPNKAPNPDGDSNKGQSGQTPPSQPPPQAQGVPASGENELHGPLIIPNSATVVRGGSTAPGGAASAEGIAKGSGVVPAPDGTVSGVSVNVGTNVSTATGTLRNGSVGVTTAGAIRDAGGALTPKPSPNNPAHAEVSDLTAEQIAALLRQEKNPNK